MGKTWHIGMGLGLISLISGCSGGVGGPGKSPGSSGGPIASYFNYQLLDDQLAQQYKGLAYTQSAQMPGTGQASFAGVMHLLVELSNRQTELVGAADINVDFGLARFEGDVTNIVDAQDQVFTGTVFIDDGILDLSADPNNAFRAFSDLVGTLQGQGYDIRINADLYGDFHGAAPTSFSGGIAGQASGANVGDYIYGSFVSIR